MSIMTMIRERDLSGLMEEFWRVVRFGIVGVAATITHATGVFAFVELGGLAPSVANPVAFAIAVPVSYFGHYFFTYGSQHDHGETVFRFLAVTCSSFGISQAIVMAMEYFGGPYQAAVALFVVLVPATNFILFNLLVFRRQPKRE